MGRLPAYAYNLNSRFGTAPSSDMVATVTPRASRYTWTRSSTTPPPRPARATTAHVTNKYDTQLDTPTADIDECTTDDLDDWSDLYEVQNCELLGLPDLETVESGSAQA